MPDTRLFHGTIMVYDVETGEEINVAVQIAVSPTKLVYTMRGIGAEHDPATLTVHDQGRCQGSLDVIERMRRVSVPA